MIFTRSIPKRRYRNYSLYRSLLRTDFQHRCAYCLVHEYHNGSDANFSIDHHRPRNGMYARRDLENEYANLYWCCNECNQNKGDQWTSPQEETLGFGWLDPCESWGDHDLHWQINSDGEIAWLTSVGEYTVKKLMLHEREWLKDYWREIAKRQNLREMLMASLETREIPSMERTLIEQRLQELNRYLEPPVFHRPYRK